jgi:UDP-N-acetylmuramoyl-L-alanyl-D-glutamate--2,6-diaminopimelate ligase
MEAERTTPNQLNLQKLFRSMADAHISHAVMEVSSHGLDQKRVGGCHFDLGIFTNLSPEHLDYHENMERYYRAKARLFTEVLPASSKKNVAAIINRDDPSGLRLIDELPCRAVSFGLTEGDIHTHTVVHSLKGIQVSIITPDNTIAIRSSLIGGFNLYNILAAVAASWFLKIPSEYIQKGIEAVIGIPGRMEQIENTLGIKIFIDYAHTADALGNVLKALSESGAERIITIFGCGGDRDRTKRPAMGRIAATYSHGLILTSDNPRSEHPDTIIAEIRPGVEEKGFVYAENVTELTAYPRRYCVISDRRTAIKSGIKAARQGDVVLIAGKGHETYQEAGSRRTLFDDRNEARQAARLCA